MIGQRMKLARRSAGLSLRAAAERAGVSHTMIGKYEGDAAVPSSDVLLKLAEAFGVRVEFFFRQRDARLSEVEYRKGSRLGRKTLDRIEGNVREQVERFLALEDYLPARPITPFALPETLPPAISTLGDIEDLVLGLREGWGLGNDPIPVMTDMLEERGMLVVQCPVGPEDKFDGLAAEVDGIPVIVVGRDWPGDRQRFTLAHEFGHVVLRGRLADGLDEEAAANRFAGAFLAPAPEVVKELGPHRTRFEPRELCVLKHTYGLSMGAWLFRARDVGVLDQSSHLAAVKQFRIKGWHRREPCEPYPPERPQLFEQMVFHALAEDYITESKAAELFGLPLMDFVALRNMEPADAVVDQ
jgi:Zn-dependent peptidase ImmA (M78 family)/transcriptional regulator with XRE-family HTH domain